MRRIEFKVGDMHAYRYERNGPYALVICHGAGGWGGMFRAERRQARSLHV